MTTPRDSFLKSRAAMTTRWEAIAADLRADIVESRLAVGERLPSGTHLAERFRVNRHTVRQALQALAGEGLVQARQGSGTYVGAPVFDYALQRRTRMSQNLATAAGRKPQRELLSQVDEVAGAWAPALRIAPLAPVEMLRSRTLLSGRPVSVSLSVFPKDRLAGIGAAVAKHRGRITAALKALGVADYTRERSVVAARLATAEEAHWLARDPAAALPAALVVLVVNYVNVDLGGVPIEAGQTVFAADAVQLTVSPEGWEEP